MLSHSNRKITSLMDVVSFLIPYTWEQMKGAHDRLWYSSPVTKIYRKRCNKIDWWYWMHLMIGGIIAIIFQQIPLIKITWYCGCINLECQFSMLNSGWEKMGWKFVLIHVMKKENYGTEIYIHFFNSILPDNNSIEIRIKDNKAGMNIIGSKFSYLFDVIW